ncbi:MAG: FAD binding domain-containing protein, partial [Gammaproteobacteria bacterium]
MITTEFEFFAPESLDEVLALLGSGEEDVKVLSGGMSLVPMMRLGLVHPQKIVSLNRVQGMDLIEIRDDAL